MGREIGYDVYAKTKNADGNVILTRVDLGDDVITWTSGRCSITDGWSYGSEWHWDSEDYTYAVLDKECDGLRSDGNDHDRFSKDSTGHCILRYVEPESFIAEARREADDCLAQHEKEVRAQSKSLGTLKELYEKVLEKIADTDDDSKRKRLEKEADRLLDRISQCEETREDDWDDYYVSKAREVIEMIDGMTNYMKMGLVVVPFFSD